MSKPITPGRMFFYLFLIVTVPICWFAVVGESDSTTSSESRKSSAASEVASKHAQRRYIVSTKQLYSAFINNENPKYVDAMLTVTGVVHDYQSEPNGRGDAMILGFVPDDSEYRQGAVRCWFTELSKRPARGTEVKVSGKCRGRDPLYVDLVFGRVLSGN